MDNGVKYAIGKFEHSIKIASENKELTDLLPKIRKEYNRVKNMTKTGDLIEHFEKFSMGQNQHKEEFEIFKKYSIIPSEEMAEVLKKKFPEEINNKTSISDFKRQKVYSSYEINSVFKVSDQGGGIRASNTTNTIVLTLFPDNGIYVNKWVGNELHYIGSGQEGDQSLTRMNKSLFDAEDMGRSIHLFESLRSNEYLYHGKVEVLGSPHIIRQPDINNVLRNVLVFRLRVLDGNGAAPIREKDYNEMLEKRRKSILKLSIEELENLAKNSSKENSSRTVVSTVIDRDPAVSEYVKLRAKGYCDLCDQKAPFENKFGQPYLECHHVEYLSKGGSDTVDNAVALCPNCHRKIHSLENKDDYIKLIRKLKYYE